MHPRAHVEAVRELSARGGAFDPDTPLSPGSWEAALHAAGGACALVDALLGGGEAPTGFSALRPPGHHGEAERAMGFCLFANVAVAARHALDSLGAERVLVLDWDVHHGNGTNAIFHASREVLFASIHQWPFYPGTGPLADVGSGEGEGYTINLPVPAGSGEDVWLRAGRARGPAGGAAVRARPRAGLGRASTRTATTRSAAARSRRPRSPSSRARCSTPRRAGGRGARGRLRPRRARRRLAATMEALAAGGEPGSHPVEPVTERARQALGRYWDL